MTATVLKSKTQTQTGSNERLFILTRTHSMQIFGEIPCVKPQNDTQTTDKRLKTTKNEREKLILFWLSFCRLFGAWKVVMVRANEQAGKKKIHLVYMFIPSHFEAPLGSNRQSAKSSCPRLFLKRERRKTLKY